MTDYSGKIRKKPASLRLAIDSMCRDCIFDPVMPGTWRKQVEDCTISGCPLYPVRTVSGYSE